MQRHIIDLFAGPGGWSEGLRRLGHTDTGIELDRSACATRAAAGHRTIRADVAAYPTAPLVGRVSGLIGSAPCETFSAAGLQAGVDDMSLCHQGLDDLAAGRDTRTALGAACSDPRSLLVVEPLRYALDIRPEWIALEEVPAVEPLFAHIARVLRTLGYSTWVGILNAADYGVPQTRRRAFLLASIARNVEPPTASHAKVPEPETLFGPGRASWVTMAEVLGFPPGIDVIARGNRTTAGGNVFSADCPSWALTERARSWVLVSRRDSPAWIAVHGSRRNRTMAELSPTITGEAHRWRWSNGGDEHLLAISEASVLQDFRPNYPWQGSRTKQFEQIGNAVPPGLAAAVLATVITPAVETLAVVA
ncbi:hypothetical protein TR51_27345 [Kitasatospora griseola]|uniref:DNA (cytosine-5-)-methyltransferase n=1 Tax=Kitasatospora griseola TaxID=2064 RepID=A0A0D0NU64_KITGR|nr:DNA cytosine methyltransferase [Kitasatospora griseola]KIQ62686.1 hypothetical protein TR51_27345 [Kitasatospora griseola]